MEARNKSDFTRRLLQFFGSRKQASLKEFIDLSPEVKRQVFYSLANRLKRLGYLEKFQQRIAGRKLQSFFRITLEGQRQLQRVQNQKTKSSKKSWDGQWRLVIFDVPEDEKGKREHLRLELKARGFYMLQLSVWVTPYEVEKDLDELIEEMGARGYVRYMVVKEIDRENDMLRFFGL